MKNEMNIIEFAKNLESILKIINPESIKIDSGSLEHGYYFDFDKINLNEKKFKTNRTEIFKSFWILYEKF